MQLIALTVLSRCVNHRQGPAEEMTRAFCSPAAEIVLLSYMAHIRSVRFPRHAGFALPPPPQSLHPRLAARRKKRKSSKGPKALKSGAPKPCLSSPHSVPRRA